MKYVAIFFILSFFWSGFWISFMNKKHRSFRQNAQNGNPCEFFIGEIRYRGKLHDFHPYDSFSEVKDRSGKIIKVFSSEIYPCLDFNYVKQFK